MDRAIDDNVLGVLDDYWEALNGDDAEGGLTSRSRPTVTDGETQGFFALLEELDHARRMLKEDSQCQLQEGALALDEFVLDEPPALPQQFGRYRIGRQLGTGGMGAVFLAHDTQLQRQVALKVPHFSRSDNKDVRERFLREARAAATLHHPNICSVHDIGEVDGVPYLTMAFIDGQPLTCRGVDAEPEGAPNGQTSRLALPAASALDSREHDRDAAILIRKVALALEHAHSKGIVHRDLKPGNIMLDRRGEPIVVDFGLARRMEVQDVTLTRQGLILGSLAYMSPEQALGEHERVGPASDIYSLGVIFYELLTGRLPYPGRRSSVLGRIISPEPADLAHRSDLDPDLRAICTKALAKRTEARFASMAEFAAALQNYLDGTGETNRVYAAPASLTSRLRVGVFTGPVMFLAVLLLAMFAVALGLIVIKLQTKDGTLVVEINEPGAKVTVLNEQGVVEIARASDGGTLKLSVDPGKHRLKVEKDGFSLFAKEFSLASGETESIKATLVPPQAVVSGASRQGNPSPIPAPPGLIAWWSGDGHAEDLAGANHGILQNGVGFAPGVVGQAFMFDGIDDYIHVPHSDSLNPGDGFTMEGWISFNNARWSDIVCKWSLAEDQYSYTLQHTGSRFRLCLSEGGKTNSRMDLANLTGRKTVLRGVWTHFGATFDGRTARIYVNGELDVAQECGSNRRIHASQTDLEIGRMKGVDIVRKNAFLYLAGLVDELCLYDRALTDAEIQAIYRAGAAGKIKPERAAKTDRAIGEASKEGVSVAKETAVASGETESIKATLLPPQAVISGASGQGNPSPIPAPPGLIAWWSGDGHGGDSVGANHGTLQNGVAFAPGVVGQAFSFDGNNDYVVVPYSDLLNPKAGFTMECWIFPKAMGRWQNLVSRWGEHDTSYFLQRAATNDRIVFGLTESGIRGDLAQLQGKKSVNGATWTHVAATFDNEMLRIYINGTLDAERSVGTWRQIRPSTTDLLIGSNIGNCFSGLIDELSLYARALGQGEIEAIYHAGAGGKIKPPVAAQRTDR